MASAVADVNQLVIPCIFLDQCRCSAEEENPAITSIVLKHGKTYQSSHYAGISNIPTVIQRTPMSDDQRHVKKDSETINKNASNSMNKTHGQRTRRPRNEKHLRQTVQPANKTNPVIQTLAEPDVLTQFQFLVTGCETRISELKSAVDRLKKNQENGKNKASKHQENMPHVIILESKIDELEMQKKGAQFGFQRASMCADSEIRKKREIFRLTTPLPALSKRQDFENAVNNNKFVVVMGQTGSGKSTQLTQYLADMPQFERQFVICTQPRKIAAVTLAQRVAFEFAAGKESTESKKWVGWHVGGENRLHLNNRIQYMTETVLLNQLTQAEVSKEDPFQNCAAVIVDEAHSRTITTDVLLGVLKRKIHLWPHLKVIVTSATIDTNLFSEYLGGCPVIDIPGRLFPVEVIYRPFDRDNGKVIEAVVKQAITICNEHQSGDILCFLSGQNEVEWATQKFSASVKPSASRAKKIVAYSLYGKQTPEEQQLVFQKTPDVQKVIFSTDIAETSVTIDGVKFIVDSGLTKNLVFDSARNITSLKEMMISSASAEQRKGRAGRTGPGICYRMYGEDEYNSLAKYDKAEIFLRPLSITVTLLKAMRVDPIDFHWLEKPDSVALEAATEELSLLGALDHRQNLTPLGHLIGDLQIDPGIAHMIYYSCSKGLGKVATILAGLFSVTSMVFWRGGDDETRQASDEAKKKYFSDRGDIFSSYQVFTEWLTRKEADPSLKIAKAWCMQNYINNKAMNMAMSTSHEIQLHLKRSASHIWKKTNQDRQATEEELQKLIAQAFVLNVAYQVNKNYVALRADTMTYVHPGSVFFRHKEPPQVIIYQSILRTSKTYALQITPIDMEWIRQENGALHALYEERATQVNIKETRVTPVSRGILRFILGPANRNVDELNQELDCLVHSDYDNDALVAWCKPHACNFVNSELSRKVESRKTELEMEIREDPVVGETRIVWGCGGEAKLLLFYGNYVGINVRNVLNSWNLSDVDIIVRQKLSQSTKDSFRNVFFLPKNSDQQNKTARIVFDDPYKAATALQELSAGGGLRGRLECSPALSNRPSVYKESEAWLTITFAIAPSLNSSIIMYNSMEDANLTIRLGCLGFRPSKSKAPHNSSSIYNPTEEGGYFIKQANPFNVRMTYVLYANRLPAMFDEVDVENELNRYGCPKPTYIKIIRGGELKFEHPHYLPSTTTDETDLILDYAKNNELLPLSDKVMRTFVRKDSKRKTVTIRARYESMDQIEMIYISRLCASTLINQRVRLKAQIKTSLRLEKNLWEFRQKEIEEYVKNLKTKDVFCKFETRPTTHVWLHLEVPRAENIDDIRKKLDDFLQFRFYRNNEFQLFFTHHGQKQLSAFDAKPGYLHLNAATKAIRIYGTETERQEISNKLDNLVETLKLLRIDVPLIVRKTSLNVVGKNLAKYRNPGLRDELRLLYNRLYATGTEDGIEKLKYDLKDHIIQPRGDIDIGDCGLCFSPLENPTFLQMCAHKYCSECIKHMLNQETVPYPIICPAEGCGAKVCLKDIQAIAPANVVEKIAETAINAILLDPKSKDKYQSCFKTGCEQYLPIKESKLEEKEQRVSGGDTVFCDQCNLHYCRTCCNTLRKPVERHRGVTCAANQLGDNKDVGFHRLYILDELCNLRCPRCRAVFVDFVGCCALYCPCKAGFCFFCLEDCGNDAHSHVRSCPKNTGQGVFISASQKNTVHRESRKRAIVQYLMRTCSDRGLRSSVLHSIERDLKDLEIIINPSEVNLSGFTPIADTSKHRQHILEEICTLRCPRCRTAFFDYEGCSALQCWNQQCKTHFCFFCLEDCVDDQRNHAHVIRCPKNVVPGQLYTPTDQIEMVNCKRRKEGIVKYLMSHCPDPTERQAVIDSVSINLKHLNIVIRPEDFTPPATRVPLRPFEYPRPVDYRPVPRVPPRHVEIDRPVDYRPIPQYVPQRPLVLERPVFPPVVPERVVFPPVEPIRRAPMPQPAERPRQPKKDCVIL